MTALVDRIAMTFVNLALVAAAPVAAYMFVAPSF